MPARFFQLAKSLSKISNVSKFAIYLTFSLVGDITKVLNLNSIRFDVLNKLKMPWVRPNFQNTISIKILFLHICICILLTKNEPGIKITD